MAKPEYVKLEGTPRETNKKANRELRAAKRVPAVLYGPEVQKNTYFSIDELALEKILSRAQTKVQELTIDGKVYKTLLKRTEFDPVTDRPIHADFYVLSDIHKVTLRVPIGIKGTARGVVEGGGRLFQPMKFLRIRVLPENIVAEFQVDVTPLKIGQSFHVSDLELDGIIPLDSLNRTIVTIRPPKGQLLKDVISDEDGEETERADDSLEESTSEE
ncbi:MAG: 50S ribosomal protein L25 [Balneola sp.]|nr:50S ribosomal protein L25 [Balneola sp.]|tara:strand:+ start:1079 stop:1726 length:648 start_codon:yes stop_codon:yes gene_type:complete